MFRSTEQDSKEQAQYDFRHKAGKKQERHRSLT
jgi:hypothetical protein